MGALVLCACVAVPACALRSGEKAEAARQERRLTDAMKGGRSDAAEEALGSAVRAAEKAHAKDALTLATSLDRLAEVYTPEAARSPEGQAQVLSLRRRALELRQRVLPADDPRIGESSSLLSTAYYDEGRWDLAEEYERRALGVFERALGAEDVRVATSASELATVLFQEGRYADASALQDRAVSILEKHEGDDPAGLARALNVTLELRRVQGRYDESETAGKRAIALMRKAPSPDEESLAQLLNNLAGLYKDQGRYDEAEATFRASMALRERNAEANAAALTTGYLNQGDILRLEGRLEEAAPLFATALERARRELGPDDPFLATFLNRSAKAATERGAYPEADARYQEAQALLERVAPGHPDLAQTLHDLAALRVAERRFGEAQDLFASALRIREAVFGPEHAEAALTLTEMARGLQEQGPESDALAAALLERAIHILSATSIYPESLSEALALLAEIKHRSGDREGAIGTMRRALLVVEDLRPRTGGSESTRAQFAARYAGRFHHMAAWLLEDDRVEEALDYVERGRARVLLDQLALARVDLRRDIPPEVRVPLERREAEAKARLAEAQARLAFTETRTDLGADRSATSRRIADEADAAARQLQEVTSELRRASPLWRDLVTAGGRPASLAEVRRTLLSPESLLLVYMVGAEDAHLIVVPGRGSPAHYALQVTLQDAPDLAAAAGPLTDEALDRVLRGGGHGGGLRASLANARGLAKASDDQPSAAPAERRLDALFHTLVPPPVWAALRQASEVLVVPDGPLHGLPLEALVVGRANGRPTYWLDEGPVVRYAPSATTACNLAREDPVRPPAGTASALIVADPVFSRPGLPKVAASRARQGLESLPPLPGTAAEAEAIAAALAPAGTEVTVLREEKAKESAVREALRERPRLFLHFATHGLVEEGESELRAALALTPPDAPAGGSDDDGLLQLFEIYDLDARSELAVLSACDSHAGRRVRGEGVFALSRAFLAAGARRVVASLWPVDDASTAALMASFYRRIARAAPGQPPDYARALRDARLELRSRAQWAEPYYWAPFVITGAP